MGEGREDFWKCTFCPSFVWCSFDSYSCGVPSVPYLYAAPLLLCPVFSYLLFLFISLLLLLWITNMLLLWYLIYIFLLFYCCHFMLHLCFSFYLYASNFCRGPHLLCSWFMYFFLWNFVLEHCSLSPHFLKSLSTKNHGILKLIHAYQSLNNKKIRVDMPLSNSTSHIRMIMKLCLKMHYKVLFDALH